MQLRGRKAKQKPRSKPEASEDALAKQERKGASLAFFSDSREVVRLSRSRSFNEDYLAWRTEFSRYVPSADVLEISDDQAAIREEYVPGELLASTYGHDDILLNSSHKIFSGLKDLTRYYEGPECTEQFAQFAASVSQFQGFGCTLDDVFKFLSPIRCVPSHGDLHALNIIVRVGTMEPTAIDFDSVHLRPSWFDAVRFVQYEVGRPLRKRRSISPAVVLALDEELAELVSLATGRPSLPTEWRCMVALGYLAWRRSDRISFGALDQKVERDSWDLRAWISAMENGR